MNCWTSDLEYVDKEGELPETSQAVRGKASSKSLLPEKQSPHGEIFLIALLGPIEVSNHRNTGLVDESGDSLDDEPLVKMIRKPPTDCQLSERETLLKYTDLADVQIYNRVFEICPRYDLSNKKDIIKQTVKEGISLQPRVLIKPYS
ncbi:protein DEK [Salmo salar]|uniref:Protein DEK n=1 Tax=Salmo salar TaxID=8030 RepID=A0A1S3S9N8_SALSA|nr:protein DEK-like [Salmo salar]|eukprot:XP_014061061.1 PREDICTED: protein DEK-like [Salmo salar]